MKKIRVLHVVGKMDVGGTETLIMNILRSFDRSLFDMEILSHNLEESYFDEEIEKLGVTVHRIKKFNGKNIISYIKNVNTFFKKNRYDIVHGHLSSSASIYLGIAKRYKMTTIAHSHNVYSFSLHTIFHKLFTFPTRYISEYFFAPTRLAGEDRYGKKIANGRNFFILKNGFFIDRYLFDLNIRQKTREILKIEKDTKVFIHIGRFSKQKNHKKILSVFKEYVTYNSNAKLLLIGAGKLENEIINYISENDLDSSVHMLGLRQDISQLLMASDLFIFPSLNEGLGIALVEAQTTGLPCVISDVIPQEALLNRESMKVCSLSEDDVEWRKAIDEVLKRPIDREQDFYQVKKLGYDINDVVQMLQKYYEIFSVGDK